MTNIALQRLRNQLITRQPLATPQEVVSYLGAVQAQEYADAKWALGLRLNGATDATIEQAMNDGAILRTHIMRPTWHFVAPADIRWLTRLTAPRVRAKMAYYERLLELDDEVFARSRKALAGALSGGKALTRKELSEALEAGGVGNAKGQRLGHLVHQAELEALVTSGPRRGKQFTYMLLEERVPPTKMLEGEEALAELTRRFFTSHGPATPQDFAWWSGLTVADAKRGLELLVQELAHEVIGAQTYYFSESSEHVPETSPVTRLLPWFDEYTVAYKDRSLVFAPDAEPHLTGDYDTLSPVVVVDGKAVAFWKRTLKREGVVIETKRFRELNDTEKASLKGTVERYRRFLDVSQAELN